jgi:phosphoglycolate phosphatase-like HAD superfamily hydrolase
MIYRTIIFDFDGTIADTMEESRRIFNAIAPDYNIPQIDHQQMMELRRFPINKLIEHLKIPTLRVPMFIARGTLMMRSSIGGLPLIEGMHDVLTKLRPEVDRFGILTSNAVANVEVFLDSHGIRSLFDFVSSTSKLTGKSKYLTAVKKQYSLQPETMLYVGDEVRDLKAAQKAGIQSAAVTWGYNSRETLAKENPTHLFDKPEEFLRLAGH